MSEKYTDRTLMTHGKHKFTALCRVPATYLLNFLYDKKDPKLHEYVLENKGRIQARAEGLEVPPEFAPTCKKVPYVSKKVANLELQRIHATPQDHKVPVRSYECEVCGMWHLTSKP